MTEHAQPLDEALEAHDVTLVLTPGQLVLLVVGVYLLIRLLRRLRG